MKICVTIPTRGIIFADTIRSTFQNEELLPNTIFKIITNRHIPDSHNQCVMGALETNATHILFVEDDMYIPEGVISSFIDKASHGVRYVSIDYGFIKDEKGIGNTSVFQNSEGVWWTGLGCTLLDLGMFVQEFEYPFFTDEYKVSFTTTEPFQYTITQSDDKHRYGRFDTYFGIQCMKKNIKKVVIPGRAIHLRSSNLNRTMDNNGLFDIQRLT